MKFSCALPLLFLGAMTPPSVTADGCVAPDASAFVVPDFPLIPVLPPDKNLQLLLTLLESVIPSINAYETPMAIRFTNLVDSLNWNCVAAYHPTFKSSLTGNPNTGSGNGNSNGNGNNGNSNGNGNNGNSNGNGNSRNLQATLLLGEYPLPRSPDVVTHTTDARQLCGIHALAAAVPGFFDNDGDSIDTFLAGFPASVLGITSTGLPSELLDTCADPKDEACLAGYLSCRGYSPEAMGAVVAYQLVDYTFSDGWNNQGSLAKGGRTCTANCRPFQDSTSYDPSDPTGASGCRDVTLPDGSDSCWEPLVEDNGKGFFVRQEHVAAHIGTQAIPRVLSQSDVQSRTVEAPAYDYATEMQDLLDNVGAITDNQKMMIEFGDDKIAVVKMLLGGILNNYGYSSLGGLVSYEQLIWWLVGYTSTELDAVITVWNEKVRHNLIRPTTVAQRLNPETETVNTFVNGVDGSTPIDRADFQPYIRTMPHAEYPSGSSCLFGAGYEWNNPALAFLLPPGVFDPDTFALSQPYAARSSKVEPGITPAQDINLQFDNQFDFILQGGQSRLDGGMHFSSAVPAGFALCSGIGDKVFDWATDLVGNVPF